MCVSFHLVMISAGATAPAAAANTESDYFIIMHFFNNKFSVIIITILTLVDANILYFYFLFTLYIVCYYIIGAASERSAGDRAQPSIIDRGINVCSFFFSVHVRNSKNRTQ